jgi:hypothetical protein
MACCKPKPKPAASVFLSKDGRRSVACLPRPASNPNDDRRKSSCGLDTLADKSGGSDDVGAISFVRIGDALGRTSFESAETSRMVPIDLILHDGEMRIYSGSLLKNFTHYM